MWELIHWLLAGSASSLRPPCWGQVHLADSLHKFWSWLKQHTRHTSRDGHNLCHFAQERQHWWKKSLEAASDDWPQPRQNWYVWVTARFSKRAKLRWVHRKRDSYQLLINHWQPSKKIGEWTSTKIVVVDGSFFLSVWWSQNELANIRMMIRKGRTNQRWPSFRFVILPDDPDGFHAYPPGQALPVMGCGPNHPVGLEAENRRCQNSLVPTGHSRF